MASTLPYHAYKHTNEIILISKYMKLFLSSGSREERKGKY